MTLYSRFGEQISSLTVSKASLRQRTLDFAYSTSSLLANYRAAYGYRNTAMFVLQSAIVAVFSLLSELRRHPPGPDSLAQPRTEIALEEVFRCLFACGVQMMVARGVARMAYHAAREMNCQLPPSVEELMQMLENSAWDPEDVLRIHSSLPCYSLVESTSRIEESSMTNVLRRFENVRFT